MLKNRFLLVLLTCLMSVLALQAEPITQQQALKKAERYFTSRRASRKLTPVNNARKLAPRRAGATAVQQPAYYAFNRGDAEGYVLVAADDRIEPLLGYTEEGEFDYNTIPDNMRWWLDAQEAGIRYLLANPSAPVAQVPVHDEIPEMLTTRWNQYGPYWDECPTINGQRCVTGCVATAMAQILYFQRAKSVDEVQADIPGYSTSKVTVEGVPEGSPIHWDRMLDTYGSGATGLQNEAVAQLMRYCGVAVEMNYGLAADGGSAAYSYKVAEAMNAYFGYGGAAQYVGQWNYDEIGWDALLYKELQQGRVSYLSGSNSKSGHAFVCDGYKDGQFHINWGWGGSSNGFFYLTSLDPSNQGAGGSDAGYSNAQEAIIGCEPTDYDTKEMVFENPLVKKICVENFDANKDGVFTYGEAAAVTDLGSAFQGKTIITAFTELSYFKGLTSINDQAFKGCSKLASVRIPKTVTTIGKEAFSNCYALKTIHIPSELKIIDENAFSGCRLLPNQSFPEGLTTIGNGAFSGCTAFTAIELPLTVMRIGDNAFGGCTKVTSVTLKMSSPDDFTVGNDIFRNASDAGLDYTKATLYIPQGTREFYATTEPWKNFGCIREERDIAHGSYAKLETDKYYFIYNVGTGRYLSKGEAYGTQSVVSKEPMRYKFTRVTTDTYYLTSTDSGTSNGLLFRTWTDGNVGDGVAACFVDGSLSGNKNNAYWLVKEVKDGVYTIQIASNQDHYDENLFLGVDLNHESNYSSPTYGAYSDVSYAEHARDCQWRLVPYDADDYTLYLASKKLEQLIDKGVEAKVNVTSEQEVYYNTASTLADINEAQFRLRKKLGLINFVDPAVRTIAITLWDNDGDDELSLVEAAKVTDVGVTFQKNTSIVSLEDLQYFTGLSTIANNSFQECSKLTTVKLPQSITTIETYAFNKCSKLASIELPVGVRYIGTAAFTACSSLKDVTVSAASPEEIRLVGTVFTSSTIQGATLSVPLGTKELYAAAATWKNFGTIREVRTHMKAAFSPMEPDVRGYIYNVGQQRYICGGEAYGTQAVVGDEGLIYTLKAVSASKPGVYTLAASGASKPYLFRTTEDSEIGEGIKGCFIDGSSAGSTAYWQLAPAQEDNDLFFTLQVPATDKTYVEGEYLGVQTNHVSGFTSPTYGLYWDVSLTEQGDNCYWAFIKKSDVDSLNTINSLGDELKLLLQRADVKGLDVKSERAVYDNAASTADDLTAAIGSAKKKLGYIAFADSRAETLCVNEWDTDHDGYFSYDEAAAVTDIQTVFSSAQGLKSLDELRYFTALQEIPANAFRGNAALVSLYIPAGVKKIGADAFTNSSALKYLAVLTETVPANEASLKSAYTVFVPQSLLESYAASEDWKQATFMEYTGQPVVSAKPASRKYGVSTTPTFDFTLTGAPINGTPVMKTDAVVTTPAGEHPIHVSAGTITTPDVLFVDGILTIQKATLKVKVKGSPYTRQKGEANPEFEISYSGWKNRETVAVLSAPAIATCEATADSPAGEYEIVLSGAEADNYDFEYTNGVLIVEDPNAIRGIHSDTTERPEVYNVAGQRIAKPQRGVNIINRKKVIVR